MQRLQTFSEANANQLKAHLFLKEDIARIKHSKCLAL